MESVKGYPQFTGLPYPLRQVLACAASAALTLYAVTLSAAPDFKGQQEASFDVAVSISISRQIDAIVIGGNKGVTLNLAPSGQAHGAQNYCVRANYSGHVSMKIDGESSDNKTFNLSTKTSDKYIPLAVSYQEKLGAGSAAKPVIPGTEYKIAPAKSGYDCSQATTVLTMVTTGAAGNYDHGDYSANLKVTFKAI